MFERMLAIFGISLVVTLVIMPILIPYLHKIKFGQSIRDEGPQHHKKKTGTPTMGGIVFVIIPILALVLLYPESIKDPKMHIILLAYVGYALIGFIDDFIIVVKKNNEGLKPKYKFLLQSLLAVIFYFMYTNISDTTILVPLLNMKLDLGIFYFGLIFIMFTAESNAVNLTDGLDGLCAGTALIAFAPFIIFALMQENYHVATFLIAVCGSLLGYLKFNLHPAKIFMGDTGSLALGGLLASVAMVLKQELLLVIIGAVFLLEVISVMIQVISFKTTGKRVFKMAPFHHHLELSGYSETQVVILLWGLAFIFSLVGLIIGVI